jgi:hypothetical protein
MPTQSFGNPVVAELNEPGVTKNSRENLHDTTHAVIPGHSDARYETYKKLVFAFEELISTHLEPYDLLSDDRLSGKDIYNALQESIQCIRKFHQAELNILDELESLSLTTRKVYID